jgi:hypothetical protein
MNQPSAIAAQAGLAYDRSCGGQAAIPIQCLTTQAIEPVGSLNPEQRGKSPSRSHDLENRCGGIPAGVPPHRFFIGLFSRIAGTLLVWPAA